MTVPLPGYTTKRLLRASARARVYEAVRSRDQRRVVAKVFELGDEGVEARVEHEFHLLEQLDVEGVVRALGIERVGDQLVLLLDYVDGKNLEQHVGGQPLDVEAFLPMAVSLAATLARVHERRVIHRDIKPSNVLVEAGTGRLFLADFGISVLLESERAHVYDPEVLEGTLPYISPEQSGRTSREVDFRSDLYSLGVTFYELLSGRRPFEAGEPMALIHAHLARRPTPLRELAPGCPAQLSAIVMKLLEKAPEHRYQSVRGLLADLERVADALAHGERDPSFELGELDHPMTLQLPHQLYGRALERASLQRAFERVCSTGARHVVLISGAPGLGKSALLRSLDASLSSQHGNLALGRFEPPQQRELPYRGFINALTGLVEQLLSESDERLERWRRELRAALGPIAAVVSALVPELALVLGEVPPVPSLDPGQARTRLHVALARFVSVFARHGPLVLALDDIHWADADSLELLRVLACEGGEQPVLFIATHRDGEQAGSEDAREGETPLRGFVDALVAARCELTRIELEPLARADLERMLTDVLGHERAAITELAEIVSRKTADNPLFVRQFLLHIEAAGLLRPSRDGWRFDVAEIAAAPLPDDVVGVMQAKLGRLSAVAGELLGLASCVGASFDQLTLEALANRSRAAVSAALHELEREGLIRPDHAGFAFAHERIRELALARLEPEARRSLHWDIGDLLLARHGDEAFGRQVFAVVDQLDAGLPVDSMAKDRRLLLARLNVSAGQRALDSAAWASARRYFELAVELLAPEIGDSEAGSLHTQAFLACFGQAQALAMQAPARADEAFAGLLRWPLQPNQRGMVVARRIKILDALERPADALAVALAALAELGVTLPREPSPLQLLAAVVRGLQAVKGVTRERMLAMAPVEDPREEAVLHLLAAANASAWLTSQELWVVLATTHTARLMKAGYHPSAPLALGVMSIVLMTMGKSVEALKLVEVAVEIAEQRVSTPAAAISARSNLLTMVGPPCRPFREVAKPVEAAHREAIEVGERYTAGMIGSIGLATHIEAGTHLREILELDARVRAVDDSFGGPEVAAIAEMIRRFIHVLIGSEGASLLTVDELSCELSPLMRYVIRTVEIWARLMLGEVDEPWALAQPLIGDYERVMLGSLVVPRFTMLLAVLAFARWPAAAGGEQRQIVRLLRKLDKSIRRWAGIGPDNYRPMAELVGAVLAAVRGQHDRALRGFEAARAGALDNSSHYVAGLASTCLADWAARRGLAATELGARRSAREAYERMGARALVGAIDRQHGQLGIAPLPVLERTSPTHSTHLRNSLVSDRSSIALDLATVLETMQAIGEDLELEQVIVRVLDSAIENAGADRGVLLLERTGELALVAEGSLPTASDDGGGGDAREQSAPAPERADTKFLAEPVPLRDARERMPTAPVLYVVRTGGAVVVDDVSADSRFSTDPYVVRSGVRSLLCMPIVKQTKRIGALVLENRLTTGAFTPARLEVLRILLGQAASALDNARLYAALARSEAQWRSLVDGVPDIIALMDDNAQIEFVNHMAGYGADGSRLIGLVADHFMERDSAERWRAAFAEVRETRCAREIEVCIAPPDQPRHWYATRIAPVEAGGGAKYLSISTNITARKQLEAQVRQQQRLESIGTLASGVAHEINNPVQGILNYAELMHARADDPETVREFCDEITRESERVAVIVKNLLAFSRQEREQPRERVSMAALVGATLSLINVVMRRDNVELIVDVPDTLPPLMCRPQQIQQILMNLVTNARDAIKSRDADSNGEDQRKRIEILARTFTRESGDAPAPTQWLRLTVADDGTGMSEDVRARVFDPFFTTKGRDQGTGLGLSVSHGIAVDHGGDLRVDSELGVGTRFHLELPLDG